MSANHQPFASKKGTSLLAKAKFGPGMLLQHDDLEALNAYTQNLSRLLFRSFFGCGVVCGLRVGVDEKCNKVTVGVAAGVALDGCGDPIHVPEPQRLLLDRDCDPRIPRELWVVLCGRSTCCAPRSSACGCDDDEAGSACTRERDGFEIRVVAERPGCCACGCIPPPSKDAAPADPFQDAVRDPKDPEEGDAGEGGCNCVEPDHFCYRAHYDGECPTCCAESAQGCDCNCVVLARLVNFGDAETPLWCADHSARRFIRPVLAEDPLPARDVKACRAKRKAGQAAAIDVYGAPANAAPQVQAATAADTAATGHPKPATAKKGSKTGG